MKVLKYIDGSTTGNIKLIKVAKLKTILINYFIFDRDLSIIGFNLTKKFSCSFLDFYLNFDQPLV